MTENKTAESLGSNAPCFYWSFVVNSKAKQITIYSFCKVSLETSEVLSQLSVGGRARRQRFEGEGPKFVSIHLTCLSTPSSSPVLGGGERWEGLEYSFFDHWRGKCLFIVGQKQQGRLEWLFKEVSLFFGLRRQIEPLSICAVLE